MDERSSQAQRLLEDEYFLKWIIDTDPECDSFWNTWMSDDPERLESVGEAIKIIDELFCSSERAMPEAEKEFLWRSIANDLGRNRPPVQRKGSSTKRWLRYAAGWVLPALIALCVLLDRDDVQRVVADATEIQLLSEPILTQGAP